MQRRALRWPARAVAKLGVELPNLRVSVMMTAHLQD
jgi:hypothetical protein